MSYNKGQKLSDNIAAIRVVLRLNREGRSANDDERAVLRRYSGFGGLKFILNPANSDDDIRHWKASDHPYFRSVRELYGILHDYAADVKEEQELLSSIKRSVNTAFYTPVPVIDGIVQGLREAKIDVHELLDPSAGIGKFGDVFRHTNADLRVTAFEKDLLTGKILQALHPHDAVTVDGFETIPASQKGRFDLVTSNIPFGDIAVFDPEYSRSGNVVRRDATKTIHNYFFLKALDMVRHGGLVAFITSRGVMDSPTNGQVRREMLRNADLVSAFRLPDGMFRDDAGTEVGSDLIVLQKHENKANLSPREKDFVSNVETLDGIVTSGFYDSHKENILTTGTVVGTDPYGKPSYVHKWDNGLDSLSKTLAFKLSNDIVLEESDIFYASTAPIREEKKVEQPVVQAQSHAQQHVQRPVQVKPLTKPNAQAHSAPVQLDLFSMWDDLENGTASVQHPTESERQAEETRREEERRRKEPRPFEGEVQPFYRAGIVVEDPVTRQLGVLSDSVTGQYIFTPLVLDVDQAGRMRQYILVRDAYQMLYNTEAAARTEQKELREELNRHYDNFFLKYGRLNERKNSRVIIMDGMGRDTLTLENPSDRDFVKADIFERPVSFISYETNHVDTPEEALFASLNRYGAVDLDYMSGISGHGVDELTDLLKGQIYYWPDGRYEISSKALSGNVYDKLAYVSEAIDLAQSHADDPRIVSALQETKSALANVIPPQIAFDDIGLQFGERWIPTEYYEDYCGKVFDTDMEIHYAEHIDEYSLKAANRWNLKIREEFCVHGEYKDYDGMALLSHAFHNTTPDIQKCVGYDEDGNDVKGPDMEKIQLAASKIDEIRDGFPEFLTNLPKAKRDELQALYNRKFNCFVKAKFDGSHQTFPGIDMKGLAAPKFNVKDIYKSQKDCVWMLLQNGGGICDHEVGTGKTLIMCMAAHEMHRLGLANKPMIIALKANVAEIAATYQAAFPDDKILYASEKDFSPANRVDFFNRIKNNDYACVIMSHDQFGKIPQSQDIQRQILSDEVRDIDEALDVLRKQGGNISGRMLTGLEKRKENLQVKLLELQSDMAKRKDDFVDFGNMGIDHIFVDESHQFKNLMFTTRHQRVSGLGNPTGSQKALNLLYAIRTIQGRTGKDLGATFLSGTTISNSLTELYLLFKYLRPKAMEQQGIHSFDAWAAVYAKKTSDYEFSVTNAVVQKERFRYFVKVPELATFYNEITDYRTGEDVGLDRPDMNVVLHNIKPTADQQDFNERLVQFAQSGEGELIFRAPLTDREMKGKMLIATDASRKASLDMRLISQDLFSDDPDNKASHCARLVSEYYQKFNEQKGTQFIFSDLSTYKPGEWNVFQEIKDKLVGDYGIPENEIRFIQEAKNEKQRKQIIQDMNDGKIRVLFGSTSTLGTGVNAQKRAVAVHHVDIPWRPSDLEQRDGRARRTGNEIAKLYANNNVDVIIYAVERTLDSYKFNLLQNKQLFITQLKTNSLGSRVIDEGAMDEENGMNFAEYVAILSGNDDLLQKAKLEKKVMALESERKTYMQARRDTEWRLEEARGKVEKNNTVIQNMTEDYEKFSAVVKRSEDGLALPGLTMKGVEEFTQDGTYNIEGMGEALQDAGRTVGNKNRQMGTVYGFPLKVDSIYVYDDKQKKEVYAGNRFYVEGHYLYEHNNGRLAMSKDNRIGAVRYGVQALEKIPSYIAQYQERNEKLATDIAEYERIAGKPWGKEDDLKALKKELEVLEKKIQESLDETNKSLPKPEVQPYKLTKDGRYHHVLFPRDAYPLVSLKEMREFADTGSWRSRGWVRCGHWDGDLMVSDSEVDAEFTLRQKAEEFIGKVVSTNKNRVDNLDWLIAKSKEDTKGDKVCQDNEVIFAARHLLEARGVDWQQAKNHLVTHDDHDKQFIEQNNVNSSESVAETVYSDKSILNSVIGESTIVVTEEESRQKLIVYSVGDYGIGEQGEELRRIAHQVKEFGTDNAVDAAVTKLAGIFNNLPEEERKRMVLVPVPGTTGYPGYMDDVVYKLGERTGIDSVNSLNSTPHESLYDLKKQGVEYNALPDISFEFDGSLPEGSIVVLVDNVLDTGRTLSQAVHTDFGEGVEVRAAVLAHTDHYLQHNADMEVMTLEMLQTESRERYEQEKARKQSAYTDAVNNLRREQLGNIDSDQFNRMSRLMNISWNALFGQSAARSELAGMGVDWHTGGAIVTPPVQPQSAPSSFASEREVNNSDLLLSKIKRFVETIKRYGTASRYLGMDELEKKYMKHERYPSEYNQYKDIAQSVRALYPEQFRTFYGGFSGDREYLHSQVFFTDEETGIGYQLWRQASTNRGQKATYGAHVYLPATVDSKIAVVSGRIAALEKEIQGRDERLQRVRGRVVEEMQGEQRAAREELSTARTTLLSLQGEKLRSAVAPLSDAEKAFMSQVASDLSTGNHLLGRPCPEGYRGFMNDVIAALAAVKKVDVTPRQRDLLVALSGYYGDAYQEVASQADVDVSLLMTSLLRAGQPLQNVIHQQVVSQPYSIYREDNAYIVDYERGYGVSDESVRQVASWCGGEPFERAGRVMVRFENDYKAGTFIEHLRSLNTRYTNEVRDALIERLRSSRIKVSTDIAEGERVLSQFFRAGDRQVYGFTLDGKIYIDPRIATAETPIHEYTHLWAAVLRQQNPDEWKNIVKMMKDTPEVWDYVKDNYPALHTDDEIADEALAHFSGQRGYQRLQAFIDGKENADSIFEKVTAILEKFWKGVTDFFHIHFTNKEEVADRVLADLLNGVNPLEYKVDEILGMYEQEEGEIFSFTLVDSVNEQRNSDNRHIITNRNQLSVEEREKQQKTWRTVFHSLSELSSSEMPSHTTVPGTPYTVSKSSVGANIGRIIGLEGQLDVLLTEINKKDLNRDEFVTLLAGSLGMRISNDKKSRYTDPPLVLGNGDTVTLRVSNHHAHAVNFVIEHSNSEKNYGFVFRGDNESRFKSDNRVNYLEIYYSKESIDDAFPVERHDFYRDLLNGLHFMLRNGSLEEMPFPDHLNASGVFKKPLQQLRREHPEMLFHAERQIDSANFKQWFGDWQNDPDNSSKVIDVAGSPLVVEHGTHANFTEFDINKIGENSRDNGLFGAGFYFGTKAPGWLDDGSDDYHVMKVYLDIKHPFEIADKVSLDIYSEVKDKLDTTAMRGLTLSGFNGRQMQVGEYIDHIKAVDNLIKENLPFVEELMAKDEELQFIRPDDRLRVWREHEISNRTGLGSLGLSWQVVISEQIGSHQFTAAAIQDGYDGVIVDRGEGYKEYVAFEPSQIKSAIQNVGTFRRDSNDIRFHSVGDTAGVREVVTYNSIIAESREPSSARVVSLASPAYLNSVDLQREVEALGGLGDHIIAGYEDYKTGDFVFVGNAADIVFRARALGTLQNGDDITKDSIYTLPMDTATGRTVFDNLTSKLVSKGYRFAIVGAERVRELVEHPESLDVDIAQPEKKEEKVAHPREGKPHVTSAVQLDLFGSMDYSTPKSVESSPTPIEEQQHTTVKEPHGDAVVDGHGNAFDPTQLTLRHLDDGEQCYVERRYTENGYFSFVGGDHIESDADVAYIFRSLEDKSVENSFICMVKDGKPTVIHLGIGDATSVMAPIQDALLAYKALEPDKIWFIHNHPSGNLKVSREDYHLQERMEKLFGAACQPGIIINTTSGQFMAYTSNYELGGEHRISDGRAGNESVKTYSFDRSVFDKDWNPMDAFKGTSYHDVAEFVSSHRLGEHEKLSLLVMNQNGSITGNVFLPWTNVKDVCSDKGADLISQAVLQMGGNRCLLYGSEGAINGKELKTLNILQQRLRDYNISLHDVTSVERSLRMEGLIASESMEHSYVRDGSVESHQPVEGVVSRRLTPQDREAGGAMVDQLEAMGISVHTDARKNRRVLKDAQKDLSEAGKIHHMKTMTGESYGFAYKGEIHLDIRKVDAELPLHEYAHLWCEAMRRINPQNWSNIVSIIKNDVDTLNFVKNSYPELKDENDLVEEVIAHYSGKRGADKLQKELERMTSRDADYGSRWGNIFQNISKAIQDFWKHTGDSLNVAYKDANDIADMILKDFAQKVSPVKKLEDYLKVQDKEYAAAVANGDIDKARDMFWQALRENVGNGITPFMSVDGYRGKLDRLARDVKVKGNIEAIAKAAGMMEQFVRDGSVLVPAPGHEGHATYTLDLANAIGKLANVPVADVLKCEPHDRQYDVKKASGKPLSSDALGIRMEGELPEGRIPVVIDNVVHSGNTAEACIKALGRGYVFSLASAASQERHVASLKSAAPVAYDKDGQLIPLSERFELKNRWLGVPMNYKPLDGVMPTVDQPDSIQGLEGYTHEDIELAVEDYVNEVLAENFPDEDVWVKEVTIIGSRTRGEAHEGSDLDILLEYGGVDVREDTLFNALHESTYSIEGIPVDINPINEHYSLNTADWLKRDAQWRMEDQESKNEGRRPVSPADVGFAALGAAWEKEYYQSINNNRMNTSAIESSLKVLAERLLPGHFDRVRFMKPQDIDHPEAVAVGGELSRREDGIHLFMNEKDIPLDAFIASGERNELSEVYRGLLEYSIASRIGNGKGMNFPEGTMVDGYAISTAAVSNNSLRVMGSRDGHEAHATYYITMEGLEQLDKLVEDRLNEDLLRDYDPVAAHVENYRQIMLAATQLKEEVGTVSSLYDELNSLAAVPETVDMEQWAESACDGLHAFEPEATRLNELTGGRYLRFANALAFYLSEDQVQAVAKGISQMRDSYSDAHVIDLYDKTVSQYMLTPPDVNTTAGRVLSSDIQSLLEVRNGVELMNWVRDSGHHDSQEPLELLKSILSSKSVYEADHILSAIHERDLESDHRAQVEHSLPHNAMEEHYAFAISYYINNVSSMSDDQKAMFGKLDSATSGAALQQWASEVRVGSALQGLDLPKTVYDAVDGLACKIAEANDETLQLEAEDAFGVGIVNEFRREALASQYGVLKDEHPDDVLLFRNGNGFSAYGTDAVAVKDVTGWEPRTIDEGGKSFHWMNITSDGFNVLSEKELNLRVVTPSVSIRPLAELWKDEMGAALQTIDYNISFAADKPVLIDTDGSLDIDSFKVKTLDFHSTGLTAISESGEELTIRDIPTNFYHPKGTLVVADYINGHRQTIERSLEAERPVSKEVQAEQKELYASYQELKGQHPDEVVLFRQKGFLEAFGQDADKVAEQFGIPVYERNIGGEDVHFAMLPTETYSAVMEYGVDTMNIHVVTNPVHEELRSSIRPTLTRLEEPIRPDGGLSGKVGAEIMQLRDGRYGVNIFNPKTREALSFPVELSPNEEKAYLSMGGAENISMRSDLVLALADKYFSQELKVSQERDFIVSAYDNIGLSYSPLALATAVDYQNPETEIVERYTALSVDPPFIMLYENMDDAEKNRSPRMLSDLPLDFQDGVLKQLREGMFKDIELKAVDNAIDYPRFMRVEKNYGVDEKDDRYQVSFKNDVDLFNDKDVKAVVDALGGRVVSDLDRRYAEFGDQGSAELFGQRVGTLLEERRGEVSDLLRDRLIGSMRRAGIDVRTNISEGQRLFNLSEVYQEIKQHQKPRKLNSSEEGQAYTTDASDVIDGAKLRNNLENLVKKYENLSSRPRIFLQDLAGAISAESKGSSSKYVSLEAVNGVQVTVRLANHNGSTKEFDDHGEPYAISIVVTGADNEKMKNDGEAHVEEYFYNAKALRTSPDKPLVDIIRSLQQTLYSGEYKDTTGLAEHESLNVRDLPNARAFTFGDGEAYGYAFHDKVYIDPRIATAETPIHEYTHLWAEAMRQQNPDEWKNIVELMKSETMLWNKVKEQYPHLENDDQIADEVLATYSGKRGMERLRDVGKLVKDSDKILGNIGAALSKFWESVTKFFGFHYTTAEQVADRVFYDLLNEVNPLDYTLKDVVKLSDTMPLAQMGLREQLEPEQTVTQHLERVQRLVEDHGLDYVPLTLRVPVTVEPSDDELAEDWRTEKKVFTYVTFDGNGGSVYENRQDAYDDKNSSALDSLPEESQHQILNLVEEMLDEKDQQITVYVDTKQVPEWALSAIVNGDISSLTDEEVQMVETFEEQYPNHILSPRDESPSFNSSPVFGSGADCVPVDIVRVATPRQLLMAEQMKAAEAERMKEQSAREKDIEASKPHSVDVKDTIKHLLEKDDTFRYQLLGRMQSDVKYYLGNGNRHEADLWAGNAKDHIVIMDALMRSLPEQPQWLSSEQLIDYADKMGVGEVFRGPSEGESEGVPQANANTYSSEESSVIKKALIDYLSQSENDYYSQGSLNRDKIEAAIHEMSVSTPGEATDAAYKVSMSILQDAVESEPQKLEQYGSDSIVDEATHLTAGATLYAEAVLYNKQNGMEQQLADLAVDLNETVKVFNEESKAADPDFGVFNKPILSYEVEKKNDDSFALLANREDGRNYESSYVSARDLYSKMQGIQNELNEQLPELREQAEARRKPQTEVSAPEEKAKQTESLPVQSEKKPGRWNNLDYTKYSLPEGVKVENAKITRIPPKDGETFAKFIISADANEKHYSREMYSNDINAYYKKDARGQRLNAVTLDQLVAKYFGKQFAADMSIGTVQEAQHVLAEQKEAKAAAADQKKADEEGKTDKKEKVSATLLPSVLLSSALSSALVNDGVWLNKAGKASPRFVNEEQPASAFNTLLMALHSDANDYKSNGYTTYRGALKDGYHVNAGESGISFNIVVNDRYVSRYNTDDIIDKEQYEQLDPEEKELYTVLQAKEKTSVFNIDQTSMVQDKPADYQAIVGGRENVLSSSAEADTIASQVAFLKSRHSDAMILMRNGDDYELCGEDAEKASAVLGIAIRQRESQGESYSFASFPHTDLDVYLPKLIRSGSRVAICDRLTDSADIQRYGTAAAIYDTADALVNALLKHEHVQLNTHFPSQYVETKDVLRLNNRRLSPPGEEVATALSRVGDIYRAAVAYLGAGYRLDRTASVVSLPADVSRYDLLVQELSAGVVMARQGLPAKLSAEGQSLVPYWLREIKESPTLLSTIEKDVDNAVEVLTKIRNGEAVDYSALRSEKPFAVLNARQYSISSELATIPDVDKKQVVVIKDEKEKSAAIILPAGASMKVKNEIFGLNKNQFVIALKRQGYDHVSFYNAGGALALVQPNEFYADKKVEVSKIDKYDLSVTERLDLSEEIARTSKVEIEQMTITRDDDNRFLLYVKPADRPAFTVYPEPSDVRLFMQSLHSPDFDAVRENLGQKYYGYVQRHPELKADVIMPDVSGHDLSLINKVSIVKDRAKGNTVIYATIGGEVQNPVELNKIQAQRLWLVDDKEMYKLSLAAQLFQEKESRSLGHSEDGHVPFPDGHEEGGGVRADEAVAPSPEAVKENTETRRSAYHF